MGWGVWAGGLPLCLLARQVWGPESWLLVEKIKPRASWP